MTFTKGNWFLPTIWLILLLLASLLRLSNLNGISFSYDQARDAFYSQDILKGNLKIVGPPTDLQGLFHGPVYYYALAPIYAISRDPRLVVIVFSVLNILSGLLLAKYLYQITKSKVIPLVFFFLFAISPELVFYSRFISNISLIIPFLSLAIYFSQYLPKRSGFVGLATCLALAAQAEFFLLSLFPIILIYFLIKKEKIQSLLSFVLTYVIFISPYALAEIKFKFRGLNAFFGFSKDADSGIITVLNRFISGYADLFTRNIFSINRIIAALVLLALVVWVIKSINQKIISDKLIYVILLFLSPLLLMIFVNAGPVVFFSISATIPLFIIISIFLNKYPYLIPVVLILASLQLFPVHINGIERNGIYTGSEIGQNLADEMKVVDIVSSQGADTTYDSITAPMFTNTLWSYLFDWYGKSKYGFSPTWHGTGQAGMPGDFTITQASGVEKTSVLIIDTARVQENWQKEFTAKESYYSDLRKTETVGIYKVLIGDRKL